LQGRLLRGQVGERHSLGEYAVSLRSYSSQHESWKPNICKRGCSI
jgi:hypothetical protein